MKLKINKFNNTVYVDVYSTGNTVLYFRRDYIGKKIYNYLELGRYKHSRLKVIGVDIVD